jgi:hypothetical protein
MPWALGVERGAMCGHAGGKLGGCAEGAPGVAIGARGGGGDPTGGRLVPHARKSAARRDKERKRMGPAAYHRWQQTRGRAVALLQSP